MLDLGTLVVLVSHVNGDCEDSRAPRLELLRSHVSTAPLEWALGSCTAWHGAGGDWRQRRSSVSAGAYARAKNHSKSKGKTVPPILFRTQFSDTYTN